MHYFLVASVTQWKESEVQSLAPINKQILVLLVTVLIEYHSLNRQTAAQDPSWPPHSRHLARWGEVRWGQTDNPNSLLFKHLHDCSDQLPAGLSGGSGNSYSSPAAHTRASCPSPASCFPHLSSIAAKKVFSDLSLQWE
jgi:hypothetical protein